LKYRSYLLVEHSFGGNAQNIPRGGQRVHDIFWLQSCKKIGLKILL
jgi:hypothetical protein